MSPCWRLSFDALLPRQMLAVKGGEAAKKTAIDLDLVESQTYRLTWQKFGNGSSYCVGPKEDTPFAGDLSDTCARLGARCVGMYMLLLARVTRSDLQPLRLLFIQ